MLVCYLNSYTIIQYIYLINTIYYFYFDNLLYINVCCPFQMPSSVDMIKYLCT